MKFLFCVTILCLCFPPRALSSFLTSAEQLSVEGAAFSWAEARSKSLQILIEYRDEAQWKEASVGSGSLISPDGLFVTAYHVMKYCLQNEKEVSRFSDKVDCSTEHPGLRYKARNGDREFEIEIISHLGERDSTEGKEFQTPDETLKHRDFVVGKLKAKPNERFSYWKLRDSKEGTINLAHPGADFELKPLLPPKKVFIAGYPKDRGFVISHGFLNVTDDNKRGYFAVAMNVYTPAYLKSQEISTDTRWGIRVENQMSGGPVADSSSYLVGIVVTGDNNNAGVLSVENVLETFFSRSASGTYPSFTLMTTERPLYLKGNGKKAAGQNLG
ncbi:MAG TPA: serine protease [Candidatus Binatia bacterium]|nr:serine protease [Candidatus Binatia bacterium]